MPRSSRGPTSAGPRMPLQMLELHQQFPRAFALDELHDLARRQIRRARQQHMHMVARHRSFQNFDLVGSANLSHQFPEPSSNRVDQNLLPILRDPDKMVLQVKTAVRACAVCLHPQILAERRT
jgi:hypothetical protein